MALAFRPSSFAATGIWPIGLVQGPGAASPFVGQQVTVQGVVTGWQADRNSRGIVFYTLFIQEPADWSDGDPATSDGLAIFLGRRRPTMLPGDVIEASGRVVEYFGLTELAADGLSWRVVARRRTLPAAQDLTPILASRRDPGRAAGADRAAAMERLEGMRVRLAPALVVGPTHAACGFAVTVASPPGGRFFRRRESDPPAPIVPVLARRDDHCDGWPQVKVGDRVTGLMGPLTFHFDQYKLVHQTAELTVAEAARPDRLPRPALPPGAWSLATWNLENLFDTDWDTGLAAEPVLSHESLARRLAKIAAVVDQQLACPTLLAVQEVENAGLLAALARQLAPACGFTYQVAHRDSPDSRGIDVALLADPRRVHLTRYQLRQVCHGAPTDVSDPAHVCPAGLNALFARPPLQVDFRLDGRPFTLFINHLKSKRGGAAATASWRLAQARSQAALVWGVQAMEPDRPVLVVGDFNDFSFSPPLMALTAGGLLRQGLLQVPAAGRYSYVFAGESQLIDGILFTAQLDAWLLSVEIRHLAADYPAGLAEAPGVDLLYRASDHDVPLAIFRGR